MRKLRVSDNLILCIDPTPDMLEDVIPFLDQVKDDLGTLLVELLAQVGDILANLQEKVANEAYLPTANKRRSRQLVLALNKLSIQAAILERQFLKALLRDN